jgi:major membrane immunogen (membrane-anchored lipoprotein)
MKRLANLAGVLLIVLLLSACGVNSGNTDELNTKNNTSDEKTIGHSPNKQNYDKGGSKGEVSIPLEIGVIAKSGSAVSSDEKEKVITELGEKLDSLFESINESKKVEEGNIK